MLDADDIRELVGFGREQAGVEFKGAGDRTNPALRGKVVRAILAMANRRDGGTVILGVRDDSTQLTVEGMTEDQLVSWKHDTLADLVAQYADPRVEFNSYRVELDSLTFS